LQRLGKKRAVGSVRYLHNGTLKERAVGFVETDNMTAEAISAMILEVLEPLQLEPGLCVGFGFDGASVMSWNRGGVHVILKKTFPHAICAL
jgi:ethanolamine ammonia-lyase small subunit